MLRLQLGLAFVGPDRLARFGGLLHLGLRLEDIETFLAGADRRSHRHGQASGLLSKSSAADGRVRWCKISRAATVPWAMRSRTMVQMPHSLHRLRSSPNTTRRCLAHQLSPASTGWPQNIPRRSGLGSPSIQRHPRKSASVSAPLLPPPTSSPTRRALLLGTSVAMFASRAALGSVSGAGSQQLGRRDDSDIAGR